MCRPCSYVAGGRAHRLVWRTFDRCAALERLLDGSPFAARLYEAERLVRQQAEQLSVYRAALLRLAREGWPQRGGHGG